MVFLALGLWLGAACEETEESTGLTPPSASSAGGGAGSEGVGGGASPACVAYGQALCDKLDECAPTWMHVAHGDATRCAYRQALSCEFQSRAPGSSLTEEVASACAESFANVRCGSIVADVAMQCPVLGGNVSDGGLCISNWQCASTYCQIGADGCGVCAARVPAGMSCMADANACEQGTGCAAGTCVPLAAETASCAGGEPCDLFMACANGACTYGAGPTAPCDGANPCDFWKQGLFCSAAATCDPAALAGSGEPCGDVMGVFTACVASGKCTMNGCVPPAEDDAACGGPSEIGCYEPRRCLEGSCELPDIANCGMGTGGGGN